jgi:hypothetical protein
MVEHVQTLSMAMTVLVLLGTLETTVPLTLMIVNLPHVTMVEHVQTLSMAMTVLVLLGTLETTVPLTLMIVNLPHVTMVEHVMMILTCLLVHVLLDGHLPFVTLTSMNVILLLVLVLVLIIVMKKQTVKIQMDHLLAHVKWATREMVHHVHCYDQETQFSIYLQLIFVHSELLYLGLMTTQWLMIMLSHMMVTVSPQQTNP